MVDDVLLWCCAALSFAWFAVHLIVGGRQVALKVRRSRALDPLVRGVVWMCWHMVTVTLASMAGFFVASAMLDMPGLAIAGVILAASFSAVAFFAAPVMGCGYAKMPQGFLFAPIALGPDWWPCCDAGGCGHSGSTLAGAGRVEDLARGACHATLAHLGIGSGHEIALLACDDARIAGLNANFRRKFGATNVLSWPSAERGAAGDGGAPSLPEDAELGDIAIAYDTCAAEAHAAGKSVANHATHLIVHGTLHLLGYDHERDGDAALMERLERDILAGMGLSDPYATQETLTER